MYALIRKDLIAGRLVLVIGLVMYILYAVTTYESPLGFFIVNIGATIMLVLAPIAIEEKYQTDTLVCHLPPSRGTVVLARYVMAWLALIVGLGLHYGLGALLSIHFMQTGFRTLCAPQAALVFCSVPVAIFSLYLPCFFRFGLGRGSFVFMVLIAVLAMFITSPFLATDMLSANGGFVLTPAMMQHPELALVALIDHVAVSVGEVRFYVTVSISAVALVSASLALSIRFFQRRDF